MDSKAQLETLERFDLTPVTDRLRAKGHADADVMEREFRRMATLWVVEPNLVTVPSPIVDIYWHAVILDTRLYSDFCAAVFGSFKHHVPGGDSSFLTSNYRATLAAYDAHFGTPDKAVWGSVSGLPWLPADTTTPWSDCRGNCANCSGR